VTGNQLLFLAWLLCLTSRIPRIVERWSAPFLSGSGWFFGIAVAPDFQHGAGRRILARYRLRLFLPWAAEIPVSLVLLATGHQRAILPVSVVVTLLTRLAYFANRKTAEDAARALEAPGTSRPAGPVVKVLSTLSLEELGVRFHLGPLEMLYLIAAIGPMVLLAPAVLIYLSTFAKSFKEAQSYMAFLVAAVAIPGILSALYPITNRPWMKPIPVLGQYILGNEILSGTTPSPLMLIAAALEALALSAVLLWMTSRLFSSEKIIFGRS
jgi:ABC-type Na+ efflux pump permease subunit